MTGAPTERLLTTTEAADTIGEDPALIRKWKQRGLLTPHPGSPPRHPLYLEADVLNTEQRTRSTRRTRGGPRR